MSLCLSNSSQSPVHMFSGTTSTMATVAITHSRHSLMRAAQRGVSDEVIRLVVQYGRKVRKQGLQYYFGATRDFPDTLDHKLVERCNDVVVILKANDIVTCYKNPKGLRNIKKKRKRLS